MKRTTKDNIWATLILVAFVGVIAFFIFAIFSNDKKCNREPRSCKSERQLICEDLGGIYFSGSVFSTANCVFPLK